MSKQEPPKKHPILSSFFFVLLVVELASSTIFVLALKRLNLLQDWQLVVAAAVLFSIFLINFVFLSIKKRGVFSKIICTILAFAAIIGSVGGVYLIYQATSFIETAITGNYETQTYKVLSLKSSAYDSLDKLKGQSIGFISTNPNLTETKDELNKSVEYTAAEYAELGSLVLDLYDAKIPAVVLSDSYIDYLAEESETTFADDTRVIFEFSIRTETPDLRRAVDVTTEPFIIYISGSDAPSGKITDRARSDVNILAVVNPKESKILLVNIPRDTYVQLHGTTGLRDKLTHAGMYGIEMSKTTIEDFLGIEINYTVKVGFHTVVKVVDAMGGIDIDSEWDFTREGCHYKAGTTHVDGRCALRFARERKFYGTGDKKRGENQQHILTRIIEKMSKPENARNYTKILEAAKGSFETSLTYDEITDFARYQLNNLQHWTVTSIQIDGESDMQPTYSLGSQKLYVMYADEASVKNAQNKIAEYLKN